MAHFKVNYVRVRSNGLPDSSSDPVSQHMRAWKLYQHELKIQRAKPWENCHVNPGKKSSHSNIEGSPLQIPARSFSRLSLQPSNNYNRVPSSLKSLQPSNKKTVRISYSAHTESHKKFEDTNVTKYKPRILDTQATSRLIQSRNYQPPKKKPICNRVGSANSAATSSKNDSNQQANSNNKSWSRRRSESSCSSSTVCDSAYEAGGSIEGFSPQSRGSTPGGEPSQDRDHFNDGIKISMDNALSLIKETEEAIEELIDRPSTPVELLDRNESLDYILFEHDLVNEIAAAGVMTNASVKEVCQTFVASHAKSLESKKVQEIVERVKNLLGIPESDSLDFSEFGLYNCTVSSLSNPELITETDALHTE